MNALLGLVPRVRLASRMDAFAFIRAPQAVRRQLLASAHADALTRVRSITTRSRGQLEKLEDEANMRVADAAAQERFLRKVGKLSPHIVLERVGSGRFASNDGVYKEYLKALVATGQLDQTSMNELLMAASNNGGGATAGFQRSFGGNSGGSSGFGGSQGGYGGSHGGYSNTGGGSSSSGGGGGGGYNGGGYNGGGYSNMGGFGAGAAQFGAGGPVQVQLVEGNMKAQLWRTARMLAFGVLVWFGLSAFMEGKGMPRGLGMGGEVKPLMEETGKTFADVCGAAEAKQELEEIVAYLRDPRQFTRLGGKLPKGVLLTGPPGTGKTLLAKSIAGEAGVPFFYSAGSDFEEMYVGVGARRVRDLFEAAKRAAPCIVFIDEIDAIGSTRALKEQQALKMTLNQLLVELDGFRESEGVIIVGATNFPEVLDPALVRPGRFDRNVVVPLPDLRDRVEILNLYLGKVPHEQDVDGSQIARGTPGASGADLANIVNVAALHAAKMGADTVTQADLEFAKDKVLMGAERRSAVIPAAVRQVTAYHEGGHALVALHTAGAMPIHKATIMPRGQALGMVHQLPEEQDMLQRSKRQMLAELDVCMGGRAAEELIFGADAVTSGASSDIQKASSIARAMVERYGMGAGAVGIMYVPDSGGRQTVSDEVRLRADDEVRQMLQDSYQRAQRLLAGRRKELDRLAAALLENESLTAEHIRLVISGKPLPASVKRMVAPVPPPKEAASSSAKATAATAAAAAAAGGKKVTAAA